MDSKDKKSEEKKVVLSVEKKVEEKEDEQDSSSADTSIQVYVRARPPNSREQEVYFCLDFNFCIFPSLTVLCPFQHGFKACVKVSESSKTITILGNPEKTFTFDHVAGSDSLQVRSPLLSFANRTSFLSLFVGGCFPKGRQAHRFQDPQGLQWNHLRLWPNWLRQNFHNSRSALHR
jgi:hypothetical protein